MSKTSKVVQAVLLVLIGIAAFRFYFAMHGRTVKLVPPPKKEVALDPDYYVTPRKLHPQDLKDAKELTRQPVWVREGYRYAYYPYGPPVDFGHRAARLGPLEKLDIEDVVLQRAPGSQGRQVMAVFEKNGNRYAVPIGREDTGTYQIYSDEMFFIQDPRQLYRHWPAAVWKAVEDHQVTPGMNELQASFAVGVGIPEGSGATNPRVVNFPDNGHPVRVTFENGKARDVRTSN